ncbi:MAG: helix-turn-helix transcriptional regulator [Pseudomonadota bacterium]
MNSPQSDKSQPDRREIEPRFRARLTDLIRRSGLSKTAFARRVGVDRSGLSQLLSGKDCRLPRAETLVAIARSEHVSLDWLLGLSEHDTLASEVAREVEIEDRSAKDNESLLLEWRREAQGAKIRYVPASLPDLLRLPEMTARDIGEAEDKRVETRIETDRETLALTRTPEADMEICMPRQRLDLLARGEGVFAAVPESLRRRQLDHMAALLDELYPTVRLFLFDERAAFSAPYTVFAMRRAALYLGDIYLVLNARAQIQALARHFDGLIRGAEIDARDAAAFVSALEAARAG